MTLTEGRAYVHSSNNRCIRIIKIKAESDDDVTVLIEELDPVTVSFMIYDCIKISKSDFNNWSELEIV